MSTEYLSGGTITTKYLFGLHSCTQIGTVVAMAENTEFSARVTRAVKAELARRDLTGGDLVEVLHIGRNAVYSRLKGEQPFDTDQLEQIARFIGIGIETLFASAALEDLRAA